jgi:hypothetical protein
MSKEPYPVEVDEKGLGNTILVPTESRPWWKLGGPDYSFVSVSGGYPTSATSPDTNVDAVEEYGRHI